jgi:hypothetical protein
MESTVHQRQLQNTKETREVADNQQNIPRIGKILELNLTLEPIAGFGVTTVTLPPERTCATWATRSSPEKDNRKTLSTHQNITPHFHYNCCLASGF